MVTITSDATAAPRVPMANRFMLALLRSRLHRLVDHRMCELRYWAPKAARLVSLPVAYVRVGERVIVLAGRADQKRWWRVFRKRHPVAIRLRGQVRAGTGTVVHAGHPASSVIRASYEEQTGTKVKSNGRFVLISLAPRDR